ncbi:Gfo/Idh/MocA family protein [Rhizobium sp. BR 314]|uniref:Gfo/Idh/MocA family protein n=1 Tax=Rhizobium sp. BR 314 TaxID=3040013 RepID=UPI0039BFE298
MLRWGFLGTSFISHTMAKAVARSAGSKLVAVSGRDPARLDAFGTQYDVPKRYDTLEAVAEDTDVDVIYVGLPNDLHARAVLAAAAQGKAVLCEKSLATTMDDARAISKAVRDSGIFFVEGLMYLGHPIIAAFGDVIASGRLGRLRMVSATYAADIWDVVNPNGNGTVFNLGCYPASLLHYVLKRGGGDAVFEQRRVQAIGNRSPKDGNICDAAAILRFDNGLIAGLTSTDSFGMSHEFTVRGDLGSLRFLTNPWLPAAGDNSFEIEIYGHPVERVTHSSDHDAFDYQVQLVEAAIADGHREASSPSPSLADSLEIMGLLTEWQALAESAIAD